MTLARCVPGDPRFDRWYRAIDARDARFDGQFFTAVSSTGIYCRPSCPARTPRRENVSFYLTSAAAHEAGFRACKRCLPEAAPGTPEWDLRRDLAGRAMRLIADGVVDREGVDGLAARLGYSVRQLGRTLTAELGAGPGALARARRAQTARSLIVGTDLKLADVAFAAGFGSVRQFNDTVREVFDTTPRALRERRNGTAPTVGLTIALPVRQPYDAPGVFGFLAARAVAGVESVDLGPTATRSAAEGSTTPASAPRASTGQPHGGVLRYARTLSLPHGPGAAEVTAERTPSGWRLRAVLELTSLADVAVATTRIRRLLDLDADPVAIDAALSADPALAPLVAATPGIRVPGAVDPHELVVRALVGQQISVAAARGHLSRLTDLIGTPVVSSFAGLDRLFPTAAQVAAGIPAPGTQLDPDRPLRLPGRSITTIRDTAAALADGSLQVDVGADTTPLAAALVERPGIGPWTAAYVAMRVLGDPDVWLPGDAALLTSARAHGVLDPALPRGAAHRALTARAAEWAPWRSYAVTHLWRAAP
ncbi:AlkA N-terminal domain-containing protein [Cellulomonas taurus]|uniref:AlkA N-terminal domain-containing protein n=1 Tax=Cellulomonas taurus TaxID=2729175 RepID=UPI00145EE0EB|nr:AlkA N-terminal domain-containing protein [Cellulomonas taurus]